MMSRSMNIRIMVTVFFFLVSFSFLVLTLCASANKDIRFAVFAYGFNFNITFKFFKRFFFITALFASFLIGFTALCTSRIRKRNKRYAQKQENNRRRVKESHEKTPVPSQFAAVHDVRRIGKYKRLTISLRFPL